MVGTEYSPNSNQELVNHDIVFPTKSRITDNIKTNNMAKVQLPSMAPVAMGRNFNAGLENATMGMK